MYESDMILPRFKCTLMCRKYCSSHLLLGTQIVFSWDHKSLRLLARDANFCLRRVLSRWYQVSVDKGLTFVPLEQNDHESTELLNGSFNSTAHLVLWKYSYRKNSRQTA